MVNLRALIIFGIFSLSIVPQTKAQDQLYYFERYSTNDGLSQGHVQGILQDKHGFMWFATDGGLNLFNGYEFSIYRNDPLDKNTISNNFVHDIVEDETGNFWIATESGLDYLDKTRNKITRYQPGHEISANDLLIDQSKNIWLGTSSGLYRFDIKNKKFTAFQHNPTLPNSLSDNYIYNIIEDQLGDIWIGTKNGLNQLNPASGKITQFRPNASQPGSIIATWIKALYQDAAGNIWIGSQGKGVEFYDRNHNQFIHFRHDPKNKNSLAHDDILSFSEDRFGRLWIGTENGGISIYDKATQQFTTIVNELSDHHSLSSNSVYKIYRDTDGNMWAGTWANGVNVHPATPPKFRSYTAIPGKNSLNNAAALSIIEDNNGIVWIGTDGGGLNRLDPATNLFSSYSHHDEDHPDLNSKHIISVIQLKNNQIGLGYHRGGFDLFNPQTKTFKHPIRLANMDDITAEISGNTMFEDKLGNIWIGTWGNGVCKYNPTNNQIIYYRQLPNKTQLPSDFINSITEDKNGNIWIGTTDGLTKLNPVTNSFQTFKHQQDISTSIIHNQILTLYRDSQNRIWIGTAGGLELFIERTGHFIHFSTADGLPDNNVTAIIEDNNNRLWLGTDNGLSCFFEKESIFRNFNITDGLPSNAFKSNSVFKNKAGYIYFGTAEGFLKFHPDSLQDNRKIPPVYITGFSLFNKLQLPGQKESILDSSIEHITQIKLTHKQSVITFEFTALNYIQPSKNQFSYKLEGFDRDWIFCGNRRMVTYTNLPPGKYTFRVKASNNDGFWNEVGTHIELTIEPPFWKTWWFYLFLFLSIPGSIFLWVRHRIKTIHLQNVRLEEQVQAQTHQLILANQEEHKARKEADLANLQLRQKNKELEQFAYVASHDLQEPLRTTLGFIKLLEKKFQGNLDEDTKRYLQFISGASERMKTLISDLLEYSRIGRQSNLSTINSNELVQTVITDLSAYINETGATVNFENLPIVKGYPTELKLLFQNLIINAIKFRKKDVAPQIFIKVHSNETHWIFEVKDNGIGIDPKYHHK
ncbi:MAG: hypothetical protein RLY16_2092, partial [Bacteroidota bacterium]